MKTTKNPRNFTFTFTLENGETYTSRWYASRKYVENRVAYQKSIGRTDAKLITKGGAK